jgi:hypothetical protein
MVFKIRNVFWKPFLFIFDATIGLLKASLMCTNTLQI